MKAHLILTRTKHENQAVAYTKTVGIKVGLDQGEDTLIFNDSARAVLTMDAADKVIVNIIQTKAAGFHQRSCR